MSSNAKRTTLKVLSLVVPLGMFLAVPIFGLERSELFLVYIFFYMVVGIVLFELSRRVD